MSVNELDAELNRMILAGQAMDAFEKFYAGDVSMRENFDPPTTGKAANRERELAFFQSVETFHGARLLASAVSGDVSFSEWEYDITFHGIGRVTMAQAVVRRWRDGQVAGERFYYNKG